MKNLVGCTLFGRVDENVTCKILAVSPDTSDINNELVYFCEISECGQINFQALTESEMQAYRIKRPDRILVSEIRGNDEAALFFKTIMQEHQGKITTLHASTPHTELMDGRFNQEQNSDERVLFIEDTRECDDEKIQITDAGVGNCQCGQLASFLNLVNIYGQDILLCPKCLAALGHSCIEALL
jgi:hypothetical protein